MHASRWYIAAMVMLTVSMLTLPTFAQETSSPDTQVCNETILATAQNQDGATTVISLSDEGSQELASGSAPAISSTHLWFAAIEGGNVYTQNAQPGYRKIFLTDDGDTALYTDVALNGHYVSFLRDNIVWLHTNDDGLERPVFHGTHDPLVVGRAGMSWSPYGFEFAFMGANNQDLYIYDTLLGHTTLVASYDEEVSFIDWGPQYIALTIDSPQGQIYLVNPQDQEDFKVLVPFGSPSNLSFNSEGDLAFATWDGLESSIYIWEAGTSSADFGIVPRPDGTQTAEHPAWACGRVYFQTDFDADGNPMTESREVFSFDPATHALVWESFMTAQAGRTQLWPVNGK